MSEYTEQAERFLKAHNLEFRAMLVGGDCPKFCKDAEAGQDMDKVNTFPRSSHIHGKHYRCTISGKDRGHVAFDFWNSYADEEHNFRISNGPEHRDSKGLMAWRKIRKEGRRTVSAYDLLACITKYDPGTFKGFCEDFGYSDDSMKAFDVYRAVQEEYSKMRRFFTSAELEEMQEIN
jgi:hypothetical protein